MSMFSSNQELRVSGSFKRPEELPLALKFGLELSGYHELFSRKDRPRTCTYQITENGDFCIGWFSDIEGWPRFNLDTILISLKKLSGYILRTKTVSSWKNATALQKELRMDSTVYFDSALLKTTTQNNKEFIAC